MRLGWRIPGVNNLKLAELQKNWECENVQSAQENFSIFIMWLWYVQLLGEQNRYELVWAVMIDPPELPIRDTGIECMTGHFPPALWKGEQRDTVSLHKSITSYFMIYQDDFTQIYCSYSRTQNSECFSIISVIIFKVNIVAEHMNAKIMTIIVLFYTELKKQFWSRGTVRQNHGRPQGENEHLLPLEIGTKNQNCIENLTSAAQFLLIDLSISMTVYLPLWRSICTWGRFAVLVSRSGEFAGCAFVCRGRLRNLRADCSTVGLYGGTITWQQIF